MYHQFPVPIPLLHQLVKQANSSLEEAQVPYVLHWSIAPTASLTTDVHVSLALWASPPLKHIAHDHVHWYGDSVQVMGGIFPWLEDTLQAIIRDPNHLVEMLEQVSPFRPADREKEAQQYRIIPEALEGSGFSVELENTGDEEINFNLFDSYYPCANSQFQFLNFLVREIQFMFVEELPKWESYQMIEDYFKAHQLPVHQIRLHYPEIDPYLLMGWQRKPLIFKQRHVWGLGKSSGLIPYDYNRWDLKGAAVAGNASHLRIVLDGIDFTLGFGASITVPLPPKAKLIMFFGVTLPVEELQRNNAPVRPAKP